MRYRNTKTGAIISSPCSVSGGDWVAEETTIAIEVDVEEIPEALKEFEKVGKIVEKIAEVAKTVAETEEVNEEEEPKAEEGEVTKKQIMQELDAMGIKYNPRDKKDELYKLMLGK